MLISLRWWNNWWVYYKKHFIIDISNFFCFIYFFVCLFFWFFLIIVLLGLLKLLLEKIFLEHFSGLAFRLSRKCTCSRVFLLTFSIDWMMFLKKINISRERLFVRYCLFFRIFFIWTGLQTDWRHSISNSFKQKKFNWTNSC